MASTQVALDLPEPVYEQAQRLAQLADCKVSDLLADTIALSLAPVGVSGAGVSPVSELSNEEVLALAKIEMPATQDRRLSRLLNRQQAGKLTDAERAELLSLMQVYQEGLLRKAQALREAVHRRLIEPLTP
jgi:hypothetical protein